MTNKFDLQNRQYHFPYHYLTGVESETVYIHRALNWGLEYMTYLFFLSEYIRRQAPTSLLDVGCGDGRLISLITPFVPVVHGSDLSVEATAFARIFNPSARFTTGDLSGISQQFDMVTLVEVLEHIPDSEIPSFVDKLADRLAPHGKLIVCVPAVVAPLNVRHYRHYTPEQLEKEIGSRFEIVELFWLYRLNLLEKVLRRLLHNPLFTLNAPALRKAIWKIHRRFNADATARDGAHLVCIAQGRR